MEDQYHLLFQNSPILLELLRHRSTTYAECCTAAAPGTVREEDMLGCMKHTEVKRTEQSPGSSGRLGCLTLLSFPQPPGLDQPWDFIPDCAAFCKEVIDGSAWGCTQCFITGCRCALHLSAISLCLEFTVNGGPAA